MRFQRSFRFPTRPAVALLAALAGACGERAATGLRADDPVQLQMAGLNVVEEGRELRVTVGYRRTASTNLIVLLDRRFELGATTTSLPVHVDIADCLADSQREGASQAQGQTTCILHVTLALYDAAGALLDQRTLDPISTRPGLTTPVPETTLGVRAGSILAAPQQDTINALGFGIVQSATVVDTRGQPMANPPLTFASLDTAIARVDSQGVVRGRAVGVARIVVGVDALRDTAFVTVRQVPAQFEATVRAGELAVGDTMTVSIVARDSGNAEIPRSSLEATFASSAGGVATVSPAGLVTAQNIGTTTITVQSGSRSATLPVLVSVPPAPYALALGAFHSCRLTGSTRLMDCWGSNHHGQFGRGNLAQYTTPDTLRGGRRFTTVVASPTFGQQTCGLTTLGEAFCWGLLEAGDLLSGRVVVEMRPTRVAPALTFVSLAVGSTLQGGQYACGVVAGGQAWCWGDNSFGQLGDGTSEARSTPVQVQGGHTFQYVVAGGGFTCGLTTDGAAYCWGRNADGTVGDSTTTNRTVPTAVGRGERWFSHIAAGGSVACGIGDAGATYCWGRGDAGQLGDGSVDVVTPWPTLIGGGMSFASLSLGYKHSCGIAMNGGAYCWGLNVTGALGTGNTQSASSPTAVSGGGAFTTITAGFAHSCASDATTTRCWGAGIRGQLGSGGTSPSNVPVAVSGGIRASSISSATVTTCGVTGTGLTYCWGADFNGTAGAVRTTPVAAFGGQQLVRVASAIQSVCALTPGGTATCAGDNSQGTLGRADAPFAPTPAAVLLGMAYADIAAASNSVCGVTADRRALCWGANDQGQLGDGTTLPRPVPTAVATSVEFRRVVASLQHACGLAVDGVLYCWGANANGQLGTGNVTPRLTPTRVNTALRFGAVAVGPGFTCGIANGGAAYCWGANWAGQLGDGTTTDRSVPVPVAGELSFVELVAGGAHACGRTASGTVHCWGANFTGQVGDGSTTNRSAPVAIVSAQAFVTVSAGAAHSCATTQGGATYCWGWNNSGQLGSGGFANQSVPVQVSP